MKKFSRFAALILAAVMLTLTLCSCNYLDSKRAHQAFYTDDTRREIEYDGNKYKYINPGRLDFVFGDTFYLDEEPFYVTEKDVPVLLASRYGEYMTINDDKTLICLWRGGERPIWHIREDLYESAKKTLESAALDRYFMSWNEYPNEDDPYQEGYSNNMLIDDAMTALIKRTLETPTNERKEFTVLSKEDYMTQVFYLKPCDKDLLVTTEATIYLIKDSGKYYVWDGNEYDEYSICPVAEDDIPAVKAFFDQYDSAATWDNIRWHFENNYYNRTFYQNQYYY